MKKSHETGYFHLLCSAHCAGSSFPDFAQSGNLSGFAQSTCLFPVQSATVRLRENLWASKNAFTTYHYIRYIVRLHACEVKMESYKQELVGVSRHSFGIGTPCFLPSELPMSLGDAWGASRATAPTSL